MGGARSATVAAPAMAVVIATAMAAAPGRTSACPVSTLILAAAVIVTNQQGLKFVREARWREISSGLFAVPNTEKNKTKNASGPMAAGGSIKRGGYFFFSSASLHLQIHSSALHSSQMTVLYSKRAVTALASAAFLY